MKIGKLKVDDVDYKNGKANTWGFWSVRALSGEGQRLLKLYPEYYVLKKDWANKTNDDFYASVVYAYMVDCILKENNNNEELMRRYIDATNCCYAQKHDETKEKSYRRINCRFLEQYEDYMVEQKYPGIHDRVNAKYRKDIEEGKSTIKNYKHKNKRTNCVQESKINKTSPAANVSYVPTVTPQIPKRSVP